MHILCFDNCLLLHLYRVLFFCPSNTFYPLIFPFLFAYTLMRSLMPIVLFLQKKCHLPKWLAANGTLLLISLAFLGVFLLIGWLLFQQCKLLLTNLSIYHQIYTKSIESCCHNILRHLDYYLGLQKGSCLIFAKEQFHNLDPSSFTNLYQNIGRISAAMLGKLDASMLHFC